MIARYMKCRRWETNKVAQRGTRTKLLSDEGWLGVVATMALMASMASIVVWMAQGGTDVEVPLLPLVVASSGDEVAEVFDREGADVAVPLCPQW